MTDDMNELLKQLKQGSGISPEAGAGGFHLIPSEIIEEWSKGGYYSGDIPSLSYKYLGQALRVRGWYTYSSQPHESAAGEGKASEKSADENELKFRGIAKIDIKGPALFMGGIRLFNEAGKLYDSNGKRGIVFWRSEFSHFLSDEEIIWFYHTFNHGDEKFDDEILSNYFTKREWLNETEWNERAGKEQLGLGKEQWNHLLERLRVSFDKDIRAIEIRAKEMQEGRKGEATDDGTDIVGRVLMHHEIETGRLQYRQILSKGMGGNLIAGISYLKKVGKAEG